MKKTAIVILVTCTLSGCASLPDDPAERSEVLALNDPIEPLNRAMFVFNERLNNTVVAPIVRTYRDNTPAPVKTAVSNVLTNLRAPYVFWNDLLQARFCVAGDTFTRFVVNSTVGIGGLVDVAAQSASIESHGNDLGQTFALWGVPEGPYLVVPILGPSTVRDGAASTIEYFVEPIDYALYKAELNFVTWGREGVSFVDRSSRNLEGVERLNSTALDSYATLRTAYRQVRAADRKDPGCSNWIAGSPHR